MPDHVRPLITQARVTLEQPLAMLEKLCAHFSDHGTVTRTDQTGRIDGPPGCAELRAEAEMLHITITSPNDAGLFMIKTALADHIFAFAAPQAPELIWAGDAASDSTIPYFRSMTVQSARSLTPRMRRVTLAGDAAHFVTGGLHVRLLIPPAGRVPCWPSVSPQGRLVWPTGDDQLTARIYTVRQLDVAAGLVDLDIVLHDGAHTPGSHWAQTTRPGDVVGLMGPGGGVLPPARHYLLAGDETALPAIARMAAELPAEASAEIFLEVADGGEQQPIASKARLDLHWLLRDGAEAGTTTLLADAIRQVPLPNDLEQADFFVWVAGEHNAARAIRRYLRQERGLDRTRHMVAAYWRRGFDAPVADHEH